MAQSKQFYNLEFQLFPNPASQTMTIQLDNNVIANSTVFVRILDASGREVLQNNFSSEQIELNISNLPEGLFALQLTTNEFSKTKY